ncbi:uncharacterized protein LOC131015657 [Salvia miltiorrhiza]|uniref:uncharacterized protein LOC131015657 n=1 Tax=Salvia miltiorrhiza TaxID=226208 RepID=UPI0025AD86E5|nr:uncharacterized protein LOC131015657 [Salvia miltiorrhiza]
MQQKAPKMSKKRTSVVAHRAWELLRALLCAGKGELCRNRVALTLDAFHKLVRKIVASTASEPRTALLYGDHEFSFQSSPVVRVGMRRAPSALRLKLPRIPCITPQVDGDEDGELMWCDRAHGDYFLKEAAEMSDEGIDERAEEFIARFYQEMKQQRQISYV